MTRRVASVGMAATSILFLLTLLVTPAVQAQEKLRYSCSSQVYEAFDKERIEAFTKATGIEVEVYVAPSAVSLSRLLSGLSDVASVARGGGPQPQKEAGTMETPFCRDPLAVFVHARVRVDTITSDQLAEIFSRKITNWKELGGADEAIMLVVPGRNTAAYENFRHLAMKRKEIQYDITTHHSTLAIEVVKRFPTAISFITQGAIGAAGGVKMLKINGLAPADKGYPFFQTFTLVTKGKPTGAVKTFVDFTLSEKGQALIEKRGMTPLSP